MNTFRVAGGLPALLASIVLQACGGGGGGGTPTPPPPEGPATADSMLQPLLTGAGELKLFDPTSPDTAAVTVDTGLTPVDAADPLTFSGMFRVVAANYASASNDISDAYYRYVVYVRQGMVYRVSLLKGTSQVPVRISSLTDACRLRGLSTDYANPLNRGLRVETAGVDADCAAFADNPVRYFRLNATTSDPGVAVNPASGGLGTLLNPDGSMGGLLMQEAPSSSRLLVRRDPDFANPMTLTVLTSGTFVDATANPSRTQKYLGLQPSGAPSFGLYRYSMDTNGLQLLHSFTSRPDYLGFTSAGDDAYLYYADGNKIWRVAHNSVSPQLLHTAGGSIGFFQLTLTSGRVILLTVDNSTGLFGLFSLPKGGAGSLTTLEAFTSEEIALATTAGTRVYYSVGTLATGGVTAVQVGENGAGSVRVDGADWGGTVAKVTGDFGGLNPEATTRTILRGQGDLSGVVTVQAVDAATGATGVTLGAIADALRGGTVNFGRHALLNIEVNRLSGIPDFDTYFVDTQTPDSLRGVETSEGVDDIPVF